VKLQVRVFLSLFALLAPPFASFPIFWRLILFPPRVKHVLSPSLFFFKNGYRFLGVLLVSPLPLAAKISLIFAFPFRVSSLSLVSPFCHFFGHIFFGLFAFPHFEIADPFPLIFLQRFRKDDSLLSPCSGALFSASTLHNAASLPRFALVEWRLRLPFNFPLAPPFPLPFWCCVDRGINSFPFSPSLPSSFLPSFCGCFFSSFPGFSSRMSRATQHQILPVLRPLLSLSEERIIYPSPPLRGASFLLRFERD